MRDWNKHIGVDGLNYINDLKPTYEGLKLLIMMKNIQITFNLKPTYEGLKRHSFHSKPASFMDLKPTYEGLKQDLENADIIAKPVI